MSLEPNKDEIVIELSIDEQRKIVEHTAGEPCFRMWLTRAEYEVSKRLTPDYTYAALKDGRFSVWRRRSDLTKLLQSGDTSDAPVARLITSRILSDDVV